MGSSRLPPPSGTQILRIHPFSAGGPFGSPGLSSPYSPAPTECSHSCPCIRPAALPEPPVSAPSSDTRAPAASPAGLRRAPRHWRWRATFLLHLCLGRILRLPVPDPCPASGALSAPPFVSPPLSPGAGASGSRAGVDLEGTGGGTAFPLGSSRLVPEGGVGRRRLYTCAPFGVCL